MTTIQEINDIANDIVVHRLTIKNYEEQLEAIMESNQEIKSLKALIESSKMQRDAAQAQLIEAMKGNELKSWKTERANFARAKRVTAQVDPVYKKEIEKKLKEGKSVKGWTLSEKEYISVKISS